MRSRVWVNGCGFALTVVMTRSRLCFGALDNIPLNHYDKQLKPGTELAVRFAQVREHKKPSEFIKN
jgi:hypothetical protein